MISPIDAFVLAHTKLKVHRVRTWVAIAVSGILFGLLVAVVIASQGVFNSVESFSKEGFGSRYLVSVNSSRSFALDIDATLSDESFIKEVEDLYKTGIEDRKKEATRLGILYDPASDPSPVVLDEVSKKKKVDYISTSHWAVAPVIDRLTQESDESLSPTQITEGYNVKSIIPSEKMISPTTGAVNYMKDGKEKIKELDSNSLRMQSRGYAWIEDPSNVLSVVDGDLAKPFIQEDDFDASKGEIPVLLPVGQAETLLGLDKLPDNSSSSEKMNRLKEVRSRVGEVSESFCYRNTTSQSLISQAVAIKSDIGKNKNNKDYQKPSVVYKIPDEISCGAVEIESDTRTTQEKALADKQIEFDKKFNGYVDPVQYKINVRGVGVVPSYDAVGSMTGISGLVSMMFGSYLGSTNWAVPSDLLDSVSENYKPAEVFDYERASASDGYSYPDGFIAEFSNDLDARAFMQAVECTDDCGEEGSLFAYPFGSSSMTIAEMKRVLVNVMFWTVVIVSAIAMIILTGTVGRTIAEGRRETAIFRAIGASRGNISSIYITYTLMLAFRIIVFAIVFALALVLAIQIWVGQDVTVGAQLAFGVNDYSKQFLLVGFNSVYIPVILLVILVACLLAMAIPLLRNVKRNPIRDMRDDN